MGAKPYRIIGAYDSETCNIHDVIGAKAFPILHQLGLLDCPIEQISADDVESHTNIELYRRTYQLATRLDDLAEGVYDYVPVIVCHNLSFDMWPLAGWLNSHSVRVLAKSRQKPITFTILDDSGNACLVLWDTLVFSQQSLAQMGRDCGYTKAVGDWDYNLIRTPETPLADSELNYAKRDIYALLSWISWFLKRNPDIDPNKLGLNVVTKTGVVRERIKRRYDQVKGAGHKYNAGRYWHYLTKREQPKTDDELFTMHACTRGGFTFIASNCASIPYECDAGRHVYGYDAVSMHPSQMVAHRYPVRFESANPEILDIDFRIIVKTPLDYVLTNFAKPFPVAFNACFRFVNLRLKHGSIFEREGIATLASARFSRGRYELNEDNEQGQRFNDHMTSQGYKDEAVNPVFAFGKLESADVCDLWLTEIEAWILSRVYDYDSASAICGYETGRFERPADIVSLSVMGFYKAKNVYKRARTEYKQNGHISPKTANALTAVNIAPVIIRGMLDGALTDEDIDNGYQAVKADLNSLFGIQATKEYRQSTELTSTGIAYIGDMGICNAPKNPKALYQFGQRIVAWSRLAQVLVIELAEPHIIGVINGDTDSVKFLMDDAKRGALDDALFRYAQALDSAKHENMTRVRSSYARYYDELADIGHYECEFVSSSYCAAWNKAYCTYDVDPRDNQRHFHFTIAGIPARRGLDAFADGLASKGMSFGEICDICLGYNVSYTYSLLKLNARSFPEWLSVYHAPVVDYLGNKCQVTEPCALAIYPMTKVINDTSNPANAQNYARAKRNRNSVNHDAKMLMYDNGNPIIIGFEYD